MTLSLRSFMRSDLRSFHALAAVVGSVFALAAAPAVQASNMNWSVGVGLPGVQVAGVQMGLAGPQRVVYVQQNPVYVQPAPVYRQVQPVLVAPQVMTYPPVAYPQTVYPQATYPQVVYAPAPVYRPVWGPGFWPGHHHHHGFGGYGGYNGYGYDGGGHGDRGEHR